MTYLIRYCDSDGNDEWSCYKNWFVGYNLLNITISPIVNIKLMTTRSTP